MLNLEPSISVVEGEKPGRRTVLDIYLSDIIDIIDFKRLLDEKYKIRAVLIQNNKIYYFESIYATVVGDKVQTTNWKQLSASLNDLLDLIHLKPSDKKPELIIQLAGFFNVFSMLYFHLKINNPALKSIIDELWVSGIPNDASIDFCDETDLGVHNLMERAV